MRGWFLAAIAAAVMLAGPAGWAEWLDLSGAVVVSRGEAGLAGESAAALVLVEEVEKRTGIRLAVRDAAGDGPAIVLGLVEAYPEVARQGEGLPEHSAEGYRVFSDAGPGPRVYILGHDGRGVLFGAGTFLRKMAWGPGTLRFPEGYAEAAAPKYPIRGHQLGYRAHSNTYDAWSPAQYEQYIRELAIFGANCIENIPFQDARPGPLMPVSREELNRALGAICAKYDLDYWVWTPADFDLNDETLRAEALDKHEAFYRDTPRLNEVFFPGGDPGNNHPRLVMPFLEDIAERLQRHHPGAGVWISLQGFDGEETDYFYGYIEEHDPEWLRGVVAGPSSPPIAATRERLPERYQLRHYPDITHTVRCQYPTPAWDQAFALTLGREPINPEPRRYLAVHNWYAPYTDGFLTYSDGVNDDVNKTVWSMAGWNPETPVETMLEDYGRFFFGPEAAEEAAKGIFALEENWRGILGLNEGVNETLAHWRGLVERHPELKDNWRWQMLELRALYDAYTRDRQVEETRLEDEANGLLLTARDGGSAAAMAAARARLAEADAWTGNSPMRARIEELCDRLFEQIGMQTSMEKHQASGAERGCILDFVDYPLNNRWWLEDEFDRIRELASEAERVAALERIARWENPPGLVHYDDVGNVAKSPNVVAERIPSDNPDHLEGYAPMPGLGMAWWDQGKSRQRLSWQCYMNWPQAVRYEEVNPEGSYTVRMTGFGEALLRINGERVAPTLYGREYGELKEFPVPKHLVEGGTLELTWDRPDERHLNWRQHSRVTEVWLLRNE